MRRTPLLVVVLVAGGCAKPKSDRIELPSSPAHWTAPNVAASSPHAIERDWWRAVADPQLAGLIGQARGGNPGLTAAQARVAEARAGVRIRRSERRPSLTATSDSGRSSEVYERPDGSVDTRERDTWHIGFDAAYEQDLWGRLAAANDASSARLAADEATLATIDLTLTADVARRYFELRALDAETSIVERAVALRRQTVGVYRERLAAGTGLSLDVARGESELASVEADLVGLRRRRQDVEHALASLVGAAPGAPRVASRASTTARPPVVPVYLPSELLLRRPDVAAAQAHAQAAAFDVTGARANFYPRIRLTGSVGVGATDLFDAFSTSALVWALARSVDLPILDGGRRKAELAAAQARLEASVADLRERSLTAFREVEDGLSGAHHLEAQSQALRRAAQASSQVVEEVGLQLEGGLVDTLSVVDAQRVSLEADRAVARIDGERWQNYVSLVKALGGGWSRINEVSCDCFAGSPPAQRAGGR